MKQDIQLNFDQLECIYTKLGTYIQHVIELRDAAEEYYNVISEQVSETFKGEAQIWYDFVLMKIEALLYYAITDQELLERYLTDMQAIIAPKDPTQMMRVDRADICWNLSQVADTLLGLADVYFGYSISYPDYKATIWNDLFSGYSISERIELEKKESENRCYNYWRMSDMRSDLRNAITAHIENHNEEYIENQSTNSVDNTLWTVYNTRIKAFENKDDELGKEAQTFYEEFDAFKDYATDFLYKGAKFAKGFWDAAVGTLDGLYTLYMAMKPENQLMCWVGLMNPAAEQRITGFNETIKLLFTDQELLLENIGQGLTDSLETEGISYYLGGMAFDSLLGYGSAKVIEKIADLAGTGKTAGKIADVLDEGGTDVLNNLKPQNLMDELASSGVKYNPDDVIAVTKTADGKLVWLENGTDTAGLNHIITEHADDFLNKGITQEQIPDYVMNALENGKIVGYQGRGTGRPIYEFTYNGEIHKVAITVGDNGFVVGANPK